MMKKTLTLLLAFLTTAVLSAQSDPARIKQLREFAEDKNPEIAAIANYELAKLAKDKKLANTAAVNEAEYMACLTRASSLGHPQAKLELAVLYLTSPTLRNQQNAFPLLSELIKTRLSADFTRKDLLTVYYWLGHCYETGKGTRIDPLRAQRYYRAASIGNTDARFAVIRSLLRESDKSMLMNVLYEILLDDPAAQERADSFLGTYKLRDSFAEYLDRKSLAGDTVATNMLAENCYSGGLFARQIVLSLQYFNRAVEQGNPDAAMTLASFHEERRYHLSRDPEVLEKYYRFAFTFPRCRTKAAEKLAALCKEQWETEEKKTSGQNTDLIEKKKDLYFYYLMQAGNLSEARRFLDSLPGQEFQKRDLYLKAKEAQLREPEQYRERLRMAANGGYALAVLEYGRMTRRQEPEQLPAMIRAMHEYPWPEDARWHWELASFYRDKAAGKLFSPEKAWSEIEKSAELGGMESLEYLIRSWRDGNRFFNITPDLKKADEYTEKLLRQDVSLRRKHYFFAHLDNILKNENRTPADFNFLFRSVGLSPDADYMYAELLNRGDRKLGIERNPDSGMIMLHMSARQENFRRAVREIFERYRAAIKKTRTPEEVQLDQETLQIYQNLL